MISDSLVGQQHRGQVEKGRFPQPLAFLEKMRKNGMNL